MRNFCLRLLDDVEGCTFDGNQVMEHARIFAITGFTVTKWRHTNEPATQRLLRLEQQCTATAPNRHLARKMIATCKIKASTRAKRPRTKEPVTWSLCSCDGSALQWQRSGAVGEKGDVAMIGGKRTLITVTLWTVTQHNPYYSNFSLMSFFEI
ncbi:hypothetical protein HN51_045942 [Arachis hypogaea]